MKAITRRVNRAVRVLLILLIMAFSSVGCMRKEAKFEAGYEALPGARAGDLYLMAQSDKDTFSIDNVTLDLLYGLYDIEEVEKEYGGDPKRKYEIEGEYIFFCIYVYDIHDEPELMTGKLFEDYKAIENCYFIKEKSDEVYTKEYGYTVGFFDVINYNHKEEITIPQEAFKGEMGRLGISIVGWRNSTKERAYMIDIERRAEFGYKILDINTVQIIGQ